MTMIEIVIIVVCLLSAVGWLYSGEVVFRYLERRNEWVYENRCKLIEQDMRAYKALPSYGYMLYLRPFCWDMQKFMRGQSDE